jgi:hypothetical protein
MAKRGEKAAAIREYRNQHPEAKATEIRKALAKQKIKVSPNQVYSILSEPAQKPAEAMPAKQEPNGQPNVKDMPLVHAKQFVVAAGGLTEARKVLDFIESLQLPQ